MSRSDFEVIEGIFHDGLGTYAELMLANALIAEARIRQDAFDVARARSKMRAAMARLPVEHPARSVFEREMANIEKGARQGAAMLIEKGGSRKLVAIRHTAREYSNARAGDLRLEFADGPAMPVSVKTDKSHKVAVAEGQTPDIGVKWAERYFRVSSSELESMIKELGFASLEQLKSHYINVARLVALVITRKLGLIDATPSDFSRAKLTNLDAAKYLLRQLRLFKSGQDHSCVIIFDRSTGAVKWESALDGIDIDGLSPDRISFLPSRSRAGFEIGSEFGLRIDGRTVVSFQVKHKRGRERSTSRQYEFSDVTTRLRI